MRCVVYVYVGTIRDSGGAEYLPMDSDFNSIVGDERRIWSTVCFGLRSGWLRLLVEIVLIALISHKKDLL